MLEVHTDGQLYIDSYPVGEVEAVYTRSVDEELAIYQEAFEAMDLFLRQMENGKLHFRQISDIFNEILCTAGWYNKE